MTESIASVDSSFDAVARLLARRVGHQLDATRRSRLSRAAAGEAARLGLAMHHYVEVLEQDPEALQCLLNRVTVQETSFFRDAKQFDALARYVLPELARPVTIWSAGCSNGQEPYSVAMLLSEIGDLTSRVVATDISTQALERARRGRYSAREVADLGSRRDRFLAPAGDDFEIVPDVRARVEFSVHNLFVDPPPVGAGTCPVVMCRNVLIYFGRDEVISFVNRVADWLPSGGWLFLGYSESLWQMTDRFQLVRLDDAFVYRKRDSRSAPDPPKVRPTRAKAAKPPVQRPARSKPIEVPLAVRVPAERLDPAAAVVAFRKLAYLEPDHPVAHLHLGLALEAAGDARAARRAFAASRRALDRCDPTTLESVLEGYGVAELSVLLDRKLIEPS